MKFEIGDLVTWNNGDDLYSGMVGIVINRRLVDREFFGRASRWLRKKSPVSKRYGYDVYWLLLPTFVEKESLEFKGISIYDLVPWNGEYKETLSQNKQTRMFIEEVLA